MNSAKQRHASMLISCSFLCQRLLDTLCKVKGVTFPGLYARINRTVLSLALLPFTAAHDFRILLKGTGYKGVLVFLGGFTGHIPARHKWLAIAKFRPYPLIE